MIIDKLCGDGGLDSRLYLRMENRQNAYFFELLNLQFPLGPVLVLLDRTEEEIDLCDNNLSKGAGPGRTAGARAGASTENTCVRRMRRVD